jgi:hypothetical protein
MGGRTGIIKPIALPPSSLEAVKGEGGRGGLFGFWFRKAVALRGDTTSTRAASTTASRARRRSACAKAGVARGGSARFCESSWLSGKPRHLVTDPKNSVLPEVQSLRPRRRLARDGVTRRRSAAALGLFTWERPFPDSLPQSGESWRQCRNPDGAEASYVPGEPCSPARPRSSSARSRSK